MFRYKESSFYQFHSRFSCLALFPCSQHSYFYLGYITLPLKMQSFIERERRFFPVIGCHWTSLQVAFPQQGLLLVQHFAFPQYCNSNSNHMYADVIPQKPCNSQFINAAITQRLNNLNKRRFLSSLGEGDIQSKCRPARDSWEVLDNVLKIYTFKCKCVNITNYHEHFMTSRTFCCWYQQAKGLSQLVQSVF